MEDKDYLLTQLSCLMRFANRIKNTRPELVNDAVILSIERSKELIEKNSNIKDLDKIKQS